MKLVLKKVVPLKANEVDETRMIEITEPKPFEAVTYYNKDTVRIESRAGGQFMGKAFYLDEEHEWKLGTDETDSTVLIPLKLKS